MAANRLSPLYVVFPAVALLVAVPFILMFPPFARSVGPGAWWVTPNVITAVAILAAPGYVYAWSQPWQRKPLSPWCRRWMWGSLVLADLAFAAGTVAMMLTVLFWVFPAIAAVESVKLTLVLRREFTRQ